MEPVGALHFELQNQTRIVQMKVGQHLVFSLYGLFEVFSCSRDQKYTKMRVSRDVGKDRVSVADVRVDFGPELYVVAKVPPDAPAGRRVSNFSYLFQLLVWVI